MKILTAAAAVCLLFFVSSCRSSDSVWSAQERDIIMIDSAMLRVLQINVKDDSLVLRRSSEPIPSDLLQGAVWEKLASSMLKTVQYGENPGVGIAGPQVGVSRRVVAVQRFDKPGEPFEIYPNIRIVAQRGEKQYGPEGCLSVPDCRAEVLRWRDIDIQYTSLKTLADTTETITGFTAVIFQHECDHLDGLIFTDRL